MCHLVKRHQALNAGEGELCRAKGRCHADGIAVLAGHLDQASDGVTNEAQQVTQRDGAGVERLLGRAAEYLHQRGGSHGGGASHLGLASALGAGDTGARGEVEADGGCAVERVHHLLVVELKVIGERQHAPIQKLKFRALTNIFTISGEKVLINGKSVFQRLVLDQGFYPDGIYTASTDEALENDVKLSMAAGFNGARLHEKVFEPRFLYHCDRLGYLVWGEQGNWGMDPSAPDGLKNFLPEWMEAVERDFNHPAIIGWCPFNETWDYEGRKQDDDLLAIVYRMTKLYDTTRPCIDTSGNFHVITDIYDLHDYEQNPEEFASHYESYAKDGILAWDNHAPRQKQIVGIPVFISEYGGIKWDVEGVNKDSWGYGDGPRTEEEFLARYKGLTDVLLDNPKMFGFCYTQLYDIEQEQNGLYTYDREPKFDMTVFHGINSAKAAIEE